MGFIDRVSVTKKMWLGFGIVIFGILVMSAIIYSTSKKVANSAVYTRDSGVKFALLAKDMQINIIQVQQWLTDISATRALDGLDDGFRAAEKNAMEFRHSLSIFRNFFQNKRMDQAVKSIDEMHRSFEEFYKMGQEMAKVYIEKGPGAGNQFMEKFDPFAEKITLETENFVNGSVQELNNEANIIIRRSQNLVKIIIILGSFILVFEIVVAIIITTSIASPLKKILKTVSLIRDGNLTTKTDYCSSDEFGIIGESVDNTIVTLRSTIETIRSSAGSLTSAVSELFAVSTELLSSAQEISTRTESVASVTVQSTGNISAISSAAEQMSSSADNVASAIEEMSASIMEVSSNCQKELQIASSASLQARKGKEIVNHLGNASKSIGKVIEVINDIADQTNLLALNATIEAASAGEMGRGFSVVANEVKELAKQTALATSEVTNQIELMQSNSEAAVKAIEQVANVIDEVTIISQTIASSVEQQSATINEISRNISQVSSGARDVAANVTESAKGIKDVSGSINEIKNSIVHVTCDIDKSKIKTEELTSLAENLRALVGKFKVD